MSHNKGIKAAESFGDRLVAVLRDRDRNDWMAVGELRDALTRDGGPSLSIATVAASIGRQRIKNRVLVRPSDAPITSNSAVRFNERSYAAQDWRAVRQYRAARMGLTVNESPLNLFLDMKAKGENFVWLEVIGAEQSHASREYPLHLHVRDINDSNGKIMLWVPHIVHVNSLYELAASRKHIQSAADLIGTTALVSTERAYNYGHKLKVQWELPAPPAPPEYSPWQRFTNGLRSLGLWIKSRVKRNQ